MKILINLFVLVAALFFSTPCSYGQTNEAHIIELTSTNFSSVIDSIPKLIKTYFPGATPPSKESVRTLLEIPFNALGYTYEPTHCSKTGLIAFESNGNIAIRFSNSVRNANDMVLLGALDFSVSPARISCVNHGHSYFPQGADIPLNLVTNHVLFFGSICEDCPASSLVQCYSNMEIIIVEKNLLRTNP